MNPNFKNKMTQKERREKELEKRRKALEKFYGRKLTEEEWKSIRW